MNYSEIKKLIIAKNRDISIADIALKELFVEKSSVLSSIDNSQAEFSTKLANERERELSREIELKTSSINNTVSDLNKRKKMIQKKHEEKKEEITKKFASSDDNSVQTVTEQKSNIIEKVNGFYGNRFGTIVYNIVEPEFGEEMSMEQCWEQFNSIYSQIDFLDKFKDFEFLNKMMVSPKIDTEKKENVIMFSIGFLLISFVAITYVFPVFIIFICAIFGVNLYKSYVITEVVKDLKSLESNISIFVESNKQIRENKMNSKLIEADKFYGNKMEEVDLKLAQQESLLSEKIETIQKFFLFDDKELQNELKIQVEGLTNRVSSISDDIRIKEDKLVELRTDLGRLESELVMSKQSLVADYYPIEPRFEKVLPSDMLLEIEPEPVFFSIPENGSMLFFYDDEESKDEFIRLFLHRNLSYVQPKKLEIALYDTVYMGNNLLALSNTGVCRVVSSEEDIKKDLVNFRDLMTRRKDLVIEFGDLKKYNEYMLKIDSIIESYSLVIDSCSDFKNYLTQEYKQLVINGPTYGYRVVAFICTDKLLEDATKDIMSVADIFPNKFMIKPKKITKASKLFIKSRIVKRGR